jgi:YidC/Oxa1 family membrane protein insertase
MKHQILLSLVGIFLLSSSTFAIEETKKNAQPMGQEATLNGASLTSGAVVTSSSEKEVAKIDLPHSSPELDNGPYWIRNWELNQFKGVSIKSITGFDSNLLMTFSGADFSYLNQQKATSFKSVGEGQFEWSYSDANIDYKRTYQVEGETLLVTVTAHFKKNSPAKAYLNIVSHGMKSDPEARDREIFYFTDNKIERKNVDKGIEATEIITPVKWVGAGSRYFIFTVMPEDQTPEKVLIQNTGEFSAQASLEFPVVNNAYSGKFKVIFAPKQLDYLRSIDKTLDTTLNLGFFAIVAYPILWALKGIHGLAPAMGFGVAIIILTLIIKLLTFPLVVKSMKGMRRMAEFQPKMKALQEKHKDNKAALNQEMMVLMKSSGYNPMAGCLPMIVQMPIFFALYSVLYAAVELYREPFLFLHDLSAKDPYYITPILMALIMFLQQRVTPPAPGMDPSQRKIMMFMPLIFGAFMISTPSGLCLYMIVNATFSILQQQYLNKKMGIPGQASLVGSPF